MGALQLAVYADNNERAVACKYDLTRDTHQDYCLFLCGMLDGCCLTDAIGPMVLYKPSSKSFLGS